MEWALLSRVTYSNICDHLLRDLKSYKDTPDLRVLIMKGENQSILRTMDEHQLALRWASRVILSKGIKVSLCNFKSDWMGGRVMCILLQILLDWEEGEGVAADDWKLPTSDGDEGSTGRDRLRSISRSDTAAGKQHDHKDVFITSSEIIYLLEALRVPIFVTEDDIMDGNADLTCAILMYLFSTRPNFSMILDKGEESYLGAAVAEELEGAFDEMESFFMAWNNATKKSGSCGCFSCS